MECKHVRRAETLDSWRTDLANMQMYFTLLTHRIPLTVVCTSVPHTP